MEDKFTVKFDYLSATFPLECDSHENELFCNLCCSGNDFYVGGSSNCSLCDPCHDYGCLNPYRYHDLAVQVFRSERVQW